MALIDCMECQHKVSDQAYSCPKCGFPLKPQPQTTTLTLNKLNTPELKVYKSIFNTSFWWSTKGRITRGQFALGFIILILIFGTSVYLIDLVSEFFSNKCYSSYYYWECVSKVVNTNLLFKIPLLLTFGYILIALAVKRFHDFGKTGAYFLGLMLPIIGFYFLWILLASPSDEGKNIFGESPVN